MSSCSYRSTKCRRRHRRWIEGVNVKGRFEPIRQAHSRFEFSYRTQSFPFPATMAYETINVRMTRSNPSIHWGVEFRQQGAGLAVAFVEKDSMAEKAGVQTGDTVEAIFGTKPATVAEARSRIQHSNEVSLSLKRFVASLPSLPWSLEENGNQVVVNHFDGLGRVTGTSDKNTSGYQNSFKTTQDLSAPIGGGTQEIRKITNYKRTETREGPEEAFSQPLPVSNTISSQSNSNWDTEEGNVKKHFESNRTYTRTESSNVGPDGRVISSGAPFTAGPPSGISSLGSSASQHKTTQQYGGNTGGSHWTSQGATGFGGWTSNNQQQHQQHHNQFNSNTSAPWSTNGNVHDGHGSAAPWSNSGHQKQHGNVAPPPPPPPADYRRSPVAHQRPHSALSGRGASTTPVNYDGPRARYSRSPRTVRELSPHATIQHLQYNSPLGMYSPEAAAEAYKMQTGQDLQIDGDYPHGNRPAYMDSATRRLIAEQEQGLRHRSPTPQSSCFKRIANAVGTPVN
uniref:ZM domain-containing protein n=1 Tax=Panagrellus redivivus TaxID=6233 RepID=A0A7E4UZ23_PANRE